MGSAVFAQDAVKVDPKHYKVEFENAAGPRPQNSPTARMKNR